VLIVIKIKLYEALAIKLFNLIYQIFNKVFLVEVVVLGGSAEIVGVKIAGTNFQVRI
jgi:hypothetical protein